MWSKTIQEVKQILSNLLSKRKKAREDLSIIDDLIEGFRTELRQRKGEIKWATLIGLPP